MPAFCSEPTDLQPNRLVPLAGPTTEMAALPFAQHPHHRQTPSTHLRHHARLRAAHHAHIKYPRLDRRRRHTTSSARRARPRQPAHCARALRRRTGPRRVLQEIVPAVRARCGASGAGDAVPRSGRVRGRCARGGQVGREGVRSALQSCVVSACAAAQEAAKRVGCEGSAD